MQSSIQNMIPRVVKKNPITTLGGIIMFGVSIATLIFVILILTKKNSNKCDPIDKEGYREGLWGINRLVARITQRATHSVESSVRSKIKSETFTPSSCTQLDSKPKGNKCSICNMIDENPTQLKKIIDECASNLNSNVCGKPSQDPENVAPEHIEAVINGSAGTECAYNFANWWLNTYSTVKSLQTVVPSTLPKTVSTPQQVVQQALAYANNHKKPSYLK